MLRVFDPRRLPAPLLFSFGKYMDINFDFKGDPIGGHIEKYLLEKARVIGQQKGERNFHVFYQLLEGSTDQVLSNLGLKVSARERGYLDGGSWLEQITHYSAPTLNP